MAYRLIQQWLAMNGKSKNPAVAQSMKLDVLAVPVWCWSLGRFLNCCCFSVSIGILKNPLLHIVLDRLTDQGTLRIHLFPSPVPHPSSGHLMWVQRTQTRSCAYTESMFAHISKLGRVKSLSPSKCLSKIHLRNKKAQNPLN